MSVVTVDVACLFKAPAKEVVTENSPYLVNALYGTYMMWTNLTINSIYKTQHVVKTKAQSFKDAKIR